jgi:hypothetical protein
MEEIFAHFRVIFVTRQQSSDADQPCKNACDFLSVLLATQHPALVERTIVLSLAAPKSHHDASSPQISVQRIPEVSAVGNNLQGFLPRTPTFCHQGALGQRHSIRESQNQLALRGNLLAINQDHLLRVPIALGFADAKRPSRNHGFESSLPSRSVFGRKPRPALSRRFVLPISSKGPQPARTLENSLRKSRQRVFVLIIQRKLPDTQRTPASGRLRLQLFGRTQFKSNRTADTIESRRYEAASSD